jgi:protein-S-isoprenylcysteine O-methyltransferase Ste14
VSLEIRETHALVTNGVYAHARHPMYLAFFLQGIGAALVICNWFAGLCCLGTIAILYAFRVNREEEMMLTAFGSKYENYCRTTKRLFFI